MQDTPIPGPGQNLCTNTTSRAEHCRKSRQWPIVLLFLSPFIVGFLTFVLFPTVMSLYYSITDFNVIQPPHLIGIKNYLRLLRDPLFWQAIYNTTYLIVLGVPLSVLVGLGVAMLLNKRLHGTGLYRTLIYMPSVVPPVAVALLWTWILNPYSGLLNSILKLFCINGPGWLADARWAKPSLLIMILWGIGNIMVLFLAALQEVPEELYEAGKIDGANSVQLFLNITIPSIRQVIFYCVITSMIGLSQFFTQAFVAMQASPANLGGGTVPLGPPNHSLLLYATYIYVNGFSFLRMGYASAMAWILLLFTLGATWLLLKCSGSLFHSKG